MSFRRLKTVSIALVLLSACNSHTPQEKKENQVQVTNPLDHQPLPEARLLCDSACHMMQRNQYDTVAWQNALKLLKQATQLDSAYYFAYDVTRSCESWLGDYNGMLESTERMLSLNNQSPIIMTDLGIAYEYRYDTIRAKALYEQSLALSKVILDTMSTSNANWIQVQMNKAGTLVLLYRSTEADMEYDKAAAAVTDATQHENILQRKGVPRNNYIARGTASL